MIAGEVFVTPHSVRQFQARIAPLAYDEARAAIVAELALHGRTPVPSASGAAVVIRTRGGRYAFRAVIGRGEGAAPAVVTILRSGH